MVRFLRNCLVAKVSGPASPVLQISSDERQRVGRIASQLSEEELARFLQIMLRTFDELGYRQEQRFHLELGVLKMVHAQRILPLEQILSQLGAASEGAPKANAPTARTPLPPPRTSPSSSPVSAGTGTQVRSQPATPEKFVSPFEADRARKSRFDPEMSSAGSSAVAATATGVADLSDTTLQLAAKEINGAQEPALEANAGIREDPAAFAHDAAHVFVGISFERGEAARWNFDLDLKNLWLGEKVLRLGFGLFSCRPSVEEGTQKGHQHSNRLT